MKRINLDLDAKDIELIKDALLQRVNSLISDINDCITSHEFINSLNRSDEKAKHKRRGRPPLNKAKKTK